MITPKRIQLRRAKGWRMPENTVKVDRSTKWGNPFRVEWQRHTMAELLDKTPWGRGAWVCTTKRSATDSGVTIVCKDHADAEATMWSEYRSHLDGRLSEIGQLRGKNLACWCPLDQPCHADVLLELANGPIEELPE